MDPKHLRELLEQTRSGELPIEEALERLRTLPYEDLEHTKVDHHRALRCGFPEVIYCAGKEPADIAEIAGSILARAAFLLATRADEAAFDAIRSASEDAIYHRRARCVTVGRPRGEPVGRALIACAGTADLPVAEEARVTAEMGGTNVETLYDAGVAGIHRLLAGSRKIQESDVIVVVAGMEGALASVVGGLADAPVVAVPTSVGYGASFGGIAPLLTMLNSCAAGVSVVNIDNGFGAGYLAAKIATRSHGRSNASS